MTIFDKLILAAGTLGAVGLVSCGDDFLPPDCTSETCDDSESIGVPLHPVCADEHCADGVVCGETVEVASNADLQAALTNTVGAVCFVLAPGDYGDVRLPEGGSLLGRWADEVRVGAVTLEGGLTTVRGVDAESIASVGTATLHVQESRVRGGAVGVRLEGAGAVTISRSELTGSADYALFADSLENLTIERSFVHDVEGPGLWIQCAPGCECSRQPIVVLDSVVVESVRHAGVHLGGVDATVKNVDVRNSLQRPGLVGGVGLSASACSNVDVRDLTVEGTASAGVLMQDAAGNLGAPGEETGIIIINGTVGIWLSGQGGITVDGFEVRDAAGVGVGIDAGAQGIIIINGRIADTVGTTLPVAGGGTETVGDGLLWNAGAEASVSTVTIENSARAAFLIDGEVAAGSSIDALTLLGTDAEFGVLQQGVESGATAPSVGGGSPEVTQEATATYAVPNAPIPPATL